MEIHKLLAKVSNHYDAAYDAFLAQRTNNSLGHLVDARDLLNTELPPESPVTPDAPKTEVPTEAAGLDKVELALHQIQEWLNQAWRALQEGDICQVNDAASHIEQMARDLKDLTGR